MNHQHDHAAPVIDPVCGMTVDPEKAAGSSRVGGRVYYFCSIACKKKFNADPAAYIGEAAASKAEPVPPGAENAIYT